MTVTASSWVDWMFLFALIAFALGVVSSLVEKITVDYTFFLFVGLGFVAAGLLCSGLA